LLGQEVGQGRAGGWGQRTRALSLYACLTCSHKLLCPKRVKKLVQVNYKWEHRIGRHGLTANLAALTVVTS